MSWLENWKTTAAGIAAICTALADIATGIAHGTITTNLAADISGIVVGVGLIFARDSHTGGTK